MIENHIAVQCTFKSVSVTENNIAGSFSKRPWLDLQWVHDFVYLTASITSICSLNTITFFTSIFSKTKISEMFLLTFSILFHIMKTLCVKDKWTDCCKGQAKYGLEHLRHVFKLSRLRRIEMNVINKERWFTEVLIRNIFGIICLESILCSNLELVETFWCGLAWRDPCFSCFITREIVESIKLYDWTTVVQSVLYSSRILKLLKLVIEIFRCLEGVEEEAKYGRWIKVKFVLPPVNNRS